MKRKEAKKLIGNLISCGLFANGILDDKPEKVTAALPDLLKANRVVERGNEAAQEKQRKNGGSCSLSMTIADRGIAAMYTAASFEGGSLKEPNIVGYANGNYVLVIHERYFKK